MRVVKTLSLLNVLHFSVAQCEWITRESCDCDAVLAQKLPEECLLGESPQLAQYMA